MYNHNESKHEQTHIFEHALKKTVQYNDRKLYD